MEKDKVLNPTNAQRKERAEAAIAESEKLLAEAKAVIRFSQFLQIHSRLISSG